MNPQTIRVSTNSKSSKHLTATHSTDSKQFPPKVAIKQQNAPIKHVRARTRTRNYILYMCTTNLGQLIKQIARLPNRMALLP